MTKDASLPSPFFLGSLEIAFQPHQSIPDDGQASTIVLFGASSILTQNVSHNDQILMLGKGDTVVAGQSLDLAGSTSSPQQDTIIAAGSNQLVSLDLDGEAVVDAAVTLNGRNDSVVGGYPGTNTTIVVNGSGANVNVTGTFFNGSGNQILLNGTAATVVFGTNIEADRGFVAGSDSVIATGFGTASVTGGGASFTFDGGSGLYDINGGSAASSFIEGGSGGGSFTGGYTENDPYRVDATYIGDNTIIAGEKSSTLTGASHGSSVLEANGDASDRLIAGEYGQDTMSAGTSTGNDLYEGYSGTYVQPPNSAPLDTSPPSLVINAGAGNDTLVSGLAPETLSGGGGKNVFRFLDESLASIPPSGGTALITDFASGRDKIDLVGFAADPKQVLANATVSGGSTLLDLSNGQKIDVASIVLTTHDFTKTS